MSDEPGRLPFVQLELPGLLGPEEGRYVASAPGEPDRVVIVEPLGAPPRRRRRRRRARRSGEEQEPAPVPVTRITVAASEPVPDAEEWLRRIKHGGEERDEEVDRAVGVVNRLVRAHRAAAGDAWASEVHAEAAHLIRIGFGSGEEIANRTWADAVVLPRDHARRARADLLGPQQRIAAILRGRDEVEPSETLLLRARLDLDSGRVREATLQARVGLESLLAEAGEHTDEDLEAIAASRQAIGKAANEALRGEPSEESAETVRKALRHAERALRRRTRPRG